MKTSKTSKVKPDKFIAGYACAVSSIFASHGHDVECMEALEACGLRTMAQLKRYGVDIYDRKILAPLLVQIQTKERYWKLRLKTE